MEKKEPDKKDFKKEGQTEETTLEGQNNRKISPEGECQIHNQQFSPPL